MRRSASAIWSTTSTRRSPSTRSDSASRSSPSAAPAFADVKRKNLRLLLSGPKSSAGRPMADGETPGPGGWNRIHLIVDDIETEVARLRDAGRDVPERHRERAWRPPGPARGSVGQLHRAVPARRRGVACAHQRSPLWERRLLGRPFRPRDPGLRLFCSEREAYAWPNQCFRVASTAPLRPAPNAGCRVRRAEAQGSGPTSTRGTSSNAPAKAVCSGCPVRVECLAYALAEPQLQGVWGGTSDTERRALRRHAA